MKIETQVMATDSGFLQGPQLSCYLLAEGLCAAAVTTTRVIWVGFNWGGK